MKKILLSTLVAFLGIASANAVTLNDLKDKYVLGVMSGDNIQVGVGKRTFLGQFKVSNNKLTLNNFNGYGNLAMSLSNNKLTIANKATYTYSGNSSITLRMVPYYTSLATTKGVIVQNNQYYGYYYAAGYAEQSGSYSSNAVQTDPSLPGCYIFNFSNVNSSGNQIYICQQQLVNNALQTYMDIYAGIFLQVFDSNATGVKTLSDGTTTNYVAYAYYDQSQNQVRVLNFGARAAVFDVADLGDDNYATDIYSTDITLNSNGTLTIPSMTSSINVTAPMYVGTGGMPYNSSVQGYVFNASSTSNKAYWTFDLGTDITKNKLQNTNNSDKHVDGTYTLTDLSHNSTSANRWVTHGGNTTTSYKKLVMNVGPYMINQYNVEGTSYETTENVTSDVLTATINYDVTHDVNFVINNHGLDSKNGCYMQGVVTSGSNIDHVSDYQLFVMPGSFNSINDAGFEEAFINALDITGEEYNTNYGRPSSPSMSVIHKAGSILDGGNPGGGNLGGGSLGGNTGDDANVFELYKLVSPAQLAAAGIQGADAYTFFIKVNYTEESGLESTYHALSPATVTTGVEDILTSIEPEETVEYFNLNGVQVDGNNLTPGIYVKRQGKTSTKVWIR